MKSMIFVCRITLTSVLLSAQSASEAPAGQEAKLVLLTSQPMSSQPTIDGRIKKSAATSAGRDGEQPVRRAILKLKPAGDPIYFSEDKEQGADGEWLTRRRAKVEKFSKDGQGVAIQGYDVISYLENRPVKGTKEFHLEYGGVVWYFSKEENRNLFKQDAEKFAPQFGGFCAYAMSKGSAATANPRAYLMEGGKLFLFFDAASKTMWEQDKSAAVKADRIWPRLHL